MHAYMNISPPHLHFHTLTYAPALQTYHQRKPSSDPDQKYTPSRGDVHEKVVRPGSPPAKVSMMSVIEAYAPSPPSARAPRKYITFPNIMAFSIIVPPVKPRIQRLRPRSW